MSLKKGKTSNRGNESFVKKGGNLDYFVSRILAYIKKSIICDQSKSKLQKFLEKSLDIDFF